jgi:hypothetical protein
MNEVAVRETDHRQIPEHPSRIFDQTQLAPGHVFPMHRHFVDPVTQFDRNVKHFHIKHKPIYAQPAEQIMSHLSAESLKTALGIFEPRNIDTHDSVTKDIENPRADAAIERLVSGNLGASNGSGADHHIEVSLKMPKRYLNFCHWS